MNLQYSKIVITSKNDYANRWQTEMQRKKLTLFGHWPNACDLFNGDCSRKAH